MGWRDGLSAPTCYPILSPSPLFTPFLPAPLPSMHPHILQIKGREEEEEDRKLKRATAAQGRVQPTTEALISVSPSLMCARQNPFVSHLFP